MGYKQQGAVPPCHHPRTVPAVPGMNASRMGMAQPIGHTPWRVTAPRDPETGEIHGKPQPAPRLDPRPTGGQFHGRSKQAGQRPRKNSKRTSERNSSRAARAARHRAAKRG